MLLKAIVISMAEDIHQVYITIPVLDNSTSKSDFRGVNKRLATICTLPGCRPLYSTGDVVFVDFEQDNQEYPVVLGMLYRAEKSDSITDITAQSLKVNVNTELSNDISIGNLTYDNLNNPSSSSSSDSYSLYDGTVSIDGEEIPIGGLSGIYWATYGETTSEELSQAVQTGKLCAVKYNNYTYVLSSYRLNEGLFDFYSSDGSKVNIVECFIGYWNILNTNVSRLSEASLINVTSDIILDTTHEACLLLCNPTQNITITVRDYNHISTNAELEVMNVSDYTITLQGDTDIYINGVLAGSKSITSSYSSAVLKRIGTKQWVIQGAVS